MNKPENQHFSLKEIRQYESESDEEFINDLSKGIKLRKVPHVIGNWATFVYIKVSLKNLELLWKNAQKLQPSLTLIPAKEIHISLSRTVYLKVFHIQKFINSLLILENKTSFNLSCSKVSKYLNDERTRSFISIDIGAGNKHLLELTELVDGVLSEFNVEQYYKEPKFHFSIAWDSMRIPKSVAEELDKSFDAKKYHFPVTSVMCKIGDKEIEIKLKNIL
jgi:hypothetical protein